MAPYIEVPADCGINQETIHSMLDAITSKLFNALSSATEAYENIEGAVPEKEPKCPTPQTIRQKLYNLTSLAGELEMKTSNLSSTLGRNLNSVTPNPAANAIGKYMDARY